MKSIDNILNYSLFKKDDRPAISYGINFERNNIKHFKRPLLIFNYGLVCNVNHWKYQIPFFHEKGFPILVHDYRFHFESEGTADLKDCNFVEMSHDIDGLLKHLNFKDAIHLGHSMGVNVTLEYARLYPKNISKMVLISGTVLPPHEIMFDTNIVDLVSPFIVNFEKSYQQIFKFIWKNTYKNPVARYFVRSGGFNMKKTSDEFVKVYMQKISELPQKLFFHLMEEMKNHNIGSSLETMKTPALVMGGDKDKVIPNHTQQFLIELLPNCQFYLIKDGSHVPQVDFPDTINEKILSFIDG